MSIALSIAATGEVEEPLVLSGSPPAANVGAPYYFKFTRTGGGPGDVTEIASSAAWTALQARGFTFDGETDELIADEVLA